MSLSVWTDGLPSNLLSEFAGLIASIVATYLILDRLIARQRRRHLRPLVQSLRRAVAQNLTALALLWAYETGKASAGDVEKALLEDDPEQVTASLALVEDVFFGLEGSAEARAAFLADRSDDQITEIVRETFEDVTAIGEVAGRLSAVVNDDIELERLLAEMEASARALDHARDFAEYLESDASQPAPLETLLILSIRTYRSAQRVWTYLEAEKEQR